MSGTIHFSAPATRPDSRRVFLKTPARRARPFFQTSAHPAGPWAKANSDILTAASAMAPPGFSLENFLRCSNFKSKFANRFSGISRSIQSQTGTAAFPTGHRWRYCSLLRGQVRGSLPVNYNRRTKLRTLCPSVPGSHAATNALLSARAGLKIRGRPETKSSPLARPQLLPGPGALVCRRQAQILPVAFHFRVRFFANTTDDGSAWFTRPRPGKK